MLMDLGATKAEATVELREAAVPEYNHTDNVDNRQQRREKRFHQRRYDAALKEASFLDRTMHVSKWRAAFSRVAEKAKVQK